MAEFNTYSIIKSIIEERKTVKWIEHIKRIADGCLLHEDFKCKREELGI